ncbi:MAG: hypothetical protein M1818_003879 [Claussenomyces sp. TS43310]|nr:MAG: hypothetical protein M1818_003879 [Claussenomyces sp. TS43310]
MCKPFPFISPPPTPPRAKAGEDRAAQDARYVLTQQRHYQRVHRSLSGLVRSDETTKLGPHHRRLLAITELVWPILKPLWQPKSRASYLAIMVMLATNHDASFAALLPEEVLIAAADHGRAVLSQNRAKQADALKHFLVPWLPEQRTHYAVPASTVCCNADGLCLPLFQAHMAKFSCVSRQTAAEESPVDDNNKDNSMSEAALLDALPHDERTFWETLPQTLWNRWGSQRESADCLLDAAISRRLERCDLAEQQQQQQRCALCSGALDDDAYTHAPPLSPALMPDNRTAAGNDHARRRQPQCLTAPCQQLAHCRRLLDGTLHCALGTAQAAATHLLDAALQQYFPLAANRRCRTDVERIVDKLQASLLSAAETLKRHDHGNDDDDENNNSNSSNDSNNRAAAAFCGRFVQLRCCDAAFGLDCLRQHFESSEACPHCRHVYRARPRPHSIFALRRSVDGSWEHRRFRLLKLDALASVIE